MRDDFYESSVGPQNEKTQRIFYNIYQTLFILLVIAFCVSLYFYLIFMDNGFIFIIAFILIFGVVTFFAKRRLLCYYDYTFVSGEVRIVKVINCKRRKLKLVFDTKNVIQVGKVGSESFENLKKKPGQKIVMTSPNGFAAENQLFYVLAKVNGEEQLIIMECDEKFLVYVISSKGKSVVEKDYV